ncbi:DsrE family protein, partial [Acidianus sp. RZ1]
NDAEKLASSLNSVINLRNDLQDAEIEVVFHQSAIKALLKNGNFVNTINDLISHRITVVGCRNSLNSQRLTEDMLLQGVKVVQAGVGEIVRKQAEGWIYLKL